MSDHEPHRFSDDEIAAVYRAIRERRDMRHFNSKPVDPDVLSRLFDAAHCAPSVGFMQPWRFVRIADPAIRARLHDIAEAERLATAEALGERGSDFMRLKVQGIIDCAEVLVVGLMEKREGYIFWPAHAAGNGPCVGIVRDPEHVACRARGRDRDGLGVAVRYW